ncbi:MAG: O-antigen ligase family protein [Acidobacteria bacterium]|nr:O-antigen ligase family protein [Acidobacteriota bacterium]
MSVAAGKPDPHSSLGALSRRSRDRHSSLPFGSDRSPLAFSAARFLLLAALLAAPLAFGAVQPWAWASLAFAALLALLLWAAGNILQGELRIAWSPLYVPAALFFLLAAVQYAGRLTLDPMATREALVKLAAYLIFFFLAAQLFQVSGVRCQVSGPGSSLITHHSSLLLVISVYAFALGLFAMVQFFTSRGLIYWTISPRWGGWVCGPYVNHNHYAGLMEMLIPLAAAYVLWLPKSNPRRPLFGFAVVVLIASLLLSGSRGGFLALLAEIVVFTAILWSSIRNSHLTHYSSLVTRHSSPRLAVALALLSAALLFLYIEPGHISRRLATVFGVGVSYDEMLADRKEAALAGLRMFRAHPWLGTGLGSYEIVAPRYRRTPSDLLWDHAHNDYAEALAETGLVGALLVLCALVVFFWSLVTRHSSLLSDSSLVTRHSSLEPRPLDGLRLGATLGCIGLLVHSFSDFNLRIPANAAWFAFCAGLAVTPAALLSSPAEAVPRDIAHVSQTV